jgi:hypothetical protein
MAEPASPSTKAPNAPKLPSLPEAREWVGRRIDGIGGRALGRVAEIHVDAESGDPRWVVVRLGPIARHTAIPFEHVAAAGDRLWAAYERAWVREAPRFGPDEALTAAQEIELCLHWGIRVDRGRAAEVAGRGDDDISVVPAAN